MCDNTCTAHVFYFCLDAAWLAAYDLKDLPCTKIESCIFVLKITIVGVGDNSTAGRWQEQSKVYSFHKKQIVILRTVWHCLAPF